MNVIQKIKICFVITAIILCVSGCMKDREPTAPTPITRPLITNNTDPVNGGLNIKTNSPVKIIFTQAMDPNSLVNRFIVEDYSGKKIDGNYSIQDAAAVFTPLKAFERSSIYKVMLKGRVRDANQNSIYYNGSPVLDDTTVIFSGWFFTEGDYSEGGFNRIYAADKSNIFVYDSLDRLQKTIKYSSLMTGYSIAEDASYLLVSVGSNNKVDFINLNTNEIESSVAVSQNPQTLAVKGSFAYAVCPNAKAIEKINVTAKAIEKTFTLDFFPGEIAINTDGTKLYTLDQAKKELVIIDASSGSVIQKIAGAVASYANGDLRVDDNGRLFVCDTKGNKLKILSTANELSDAFEFTGQGPVNVCFDNSFLYAAAGSSIFKVDKGTFSPSTSKELVFDSQVKSLTVLTSKDILYVLTNNSIAVIDIKTFTVLTEIPVESITLQEIISSPTKF